MMNAADGTRIASRTSTITASDFSALIASGVESAATTPSASFFASFMGSPPFRGVRVAVVGEPVPVADGLGGAQVRGVAVVQRADAGQPLDLLAEGVRPRFELGLRQPVQVLLVVEHRPKVAPLEIGR